MKIARNGNNLKLSICMETFKQYLADNDRKASTIKRHLWNIKLIQKHCPHFSKKEIESYYEELKEKGFKNTYLNTLTSTIRQYGQHINDEILINWRFRKKEIFSKSTMSDGEIEDFLNISRPTNTKQEWHAKWTMFFSIMAFSGMRPGEVANLKVKDIDFGRQVFIITDSKTNTPRVAPIAPNILPVVKQFVDNKEGPLFKGVDNVDWHYNFHRRLSRLGIKRPNLTPYSLRHSYATRLLESDVSLFHVKKLLGHNDLKSTLVYEHLTTADLITAVSKLPLVRRGTDCQSILQSLIGLIKSFKIENDKRFTYSLVEKENYLKFEVLIKKEKPPMGRGLF